MVLKIRLARFGKRNAPFYNIVVAQARYANSVSPLLPTPEVPPPNHSSTWKTNLTNTSLPYLQNCPQLQTPRSPRHLRPDPETSATR